ncbi:MAG: CDP-diacylglycerol--glycerol-3-phosphate 3-phosphatidyltransferase [Candidatus Chromulinivorax sp.]
MFFISLPLFLTIFRLILSPIIIPYLIVYTSCNQNFYSNGIVALIFLFFGLTDFLDGFLARKYQQVTKLGGALDHLADKFLIFSSLVALVAVQKLQIFWAIALIAREFFILGLRQIALEQNFFIQVSDFGKLKTCLHIATVTFLIAMPMQESLLLLISKNFLLMLSLLFSWGSAFDYSIKFWQKIKI